MVNALDADIRQRRLSMGIGKGVSIGSGASLSELNGEKNVKARWKSKIIIYHEGCKLNR